MSVLFVHRARHETLQAFAKLFFLSSRMVIGKRGSVFGIACRLWAGRHGVRVLVGARYFSLLVNVHTVSGAPQPAVQCVPGVVLREIKRPRREVNHLPPSSSEYKEDWSYTSTAPVCLQGVDRENFAFTFSDGNFLATIQAVLLKFLS
jgi:hypothetical protein